MKRAMCLLVLAGLLSGCELLMPKEENNQPADGTQGQAQGGVDPTQFIQVVSPLPVKASELQVGYEARQEMTAGGQTNTTWYSVVGETGDAWQIEHVNPGLTAMAGSYPELKDQLIGLTVDKETGKVTKAVLGAPGSDELKELKITETPTGQPGEMGEGTPEDVTIGLGTFPAMKYTQGTQITWVGTEGDLDGVMIKVEGDQPYELAEMPSVQEVTVGGTTLTATKIAYNNGTQYWVTPNDVLAAFFPYGETSGIYKMQGEGFASEVTEVGSDAQPQLKW